MKLKTSSSVGEIDSYLGYWLRFVSNRVTLSFQERLLKKGATVSEWIVVRYLYSHAPCSMTSLSEEMGLDKGALSRLTGRLEKREIITRTLSKSDRRLSSLELTRKGKKWVPTLAQVAAENDTYFFSHMKKTQQKFFLEILKDIAELHHLKGKPLD